jgi:uncharacterized protein YycO
MANIVMQFSGNSSLTSRMIQWFGKGKYSHVDTVLVDGMLLGARSTVMSGFPEGVQIRSPDYQVGYTLKRVSIPCTDEQQKSYYDFVLQQVGKAYDKTAIMAFVTGSTRSDSDSWFCSELNTAALQKCGWLKQLSLPPSKIDPDSLLLILSALVSF